MVGCDRLGPVRIVIDYRPALRARTGVGEHIHQVTRELLRNASDEITLFSSSWKDRLPEDISTQLPRARVADRRIPVSALNFTWHRLGWPPVEALAAGEYDIAHSPHPLLLPSRSAAQVVTIHDLHFLSHPERTSAEVRRDYPALVHAHAHRADGIIVVSRFVAGEVQRRLGVPATRISVAANGAPEWSSPPAALNPDGYLLFVGTLEPRKNVSGLLEAYGRLVARLGDAPRLVVAGRANPDAADVLAAMNRSPLAGRVEYRGYVEPDGRESLFKGAQALVLPSLDEGFGIPALEAMAAGVPVIASRRGALPEVVGDAGLMIEPEDPESIVAAMERMIGDAALRATCALRGLERARQFSWAQAARDTRRAYESALVARLHRAPAMARPSNIQTRDAHRR
ncbi:MAG: glycosyltransferase family 1 protein [Acidobacteria bacterium]|nr:MAG: glycosyltransferase family 1 protein [Acidobacteriota bacterium]